jgi:hypothetical protein
MANTTYFGWETPDDTDLVKDGAAAIRTLGQAIDTSMQDLEGGTTGQVLNKNSNTDMDFVWAADSAGMTNPLTTTGDTIYSSSGSTPARLAIGSTGNILTVAGGVPTWAAPVTGGMTLLSTTTLSGTTTTISSISGSYNQLYGVIYGPTWDSGNDYFLMLPNNSSSIGEVVGVAGFGNNAYTTVENDTFIKFNPQAQQNRTNTASVYSFTINNYTSTTAYKTINHYSFYLDGSNANSYSNMGGGIKTTSAITSLRFKTGNDYNMTAGTVLLYGVK